MPVNRFIHPRLGHSKKVNLLTDLEFRVWMQYMLSADDFGVMRFSVVTLQADNDALHQKPVKALQKALERLISVGLVVAYEHQGLDYVCQLDWKTWQRFNLPNRTIHPAPPQDVLDRCDSGTLGLFLGHHPDFTNGHQYKGIEGASTCEVDATSTRLVDATSTRHVDEASVPHQHTANGLRQTANGVLEERFAEFWRCYPRKVGKDAAWKVWARLKPSPDLLAQMLSVLAWQKQQEAWQKDGGQFVPHPSTWLHQGRWQDEPTSQTTSRPASTLGKQTSRLASALANIKAEAS